MEPSPKLVTEAGFEMINNSSVDLIPSFVRPEAGWEDGMGSKGGGEAKRSRELGEAVFWTKGSSVRLSFEPDLLGMLSVVRARRERKGGTLRAKSG